MNEDAARQVMARLGIPVTHKSAKGWLNGRCPLAPWTHRKGTDRHPAFAIWVNEEGPSSYVCKACHFKGRVSQLVRTLERFSDRSYGDLAFQADVYDMTGVFGGEYETAHRNAYVEPHPVDEALTAGAYPFLREVPEALRYMKGRGISAATCTALGLLYDPDECRVLFPVRGQERELYGFTGRSILEERQYPYDGYPKVRDYLGLPKAALLLGAELFQQGKPVLAVEGLIGYAHLVEIGAREVCNPIALMGSEVTPQKASALSMLDECTYLLPDPDAAGESCLWGQIDPTTHEHNGDGAIRRLSVKGVALFVPEWPVGKIDPDQLTLAEVKHILKNCPLWTGST